VSRSGLCPAADRRLSVPRRPASSVAAGNGSGAVGGRAVPHRVVAARLSRKPWTILQRRRRARSFASLSAAHVAARLRHPLLDGGADVAGGFRSCWDTPRSPDSFPTAVTVEQLLREFYATAHPGPGLLQSKSKRQYRDGSGLGRSRSRGDIEDEQAGILPRARERTLFISGFHLDFDDDLTPSIVTGVCQALPGSAIFPDSSLTGFRREIAKALVRLSRGHYVDIIGYVPLGRSDQPSPAPEAHDPTRSPSTPSPFIALCNQKGGVQNDDQINLGAALSEFGRRVLLVDFPIHRPLSFCLESIPTISRPTVYRRAEMERFGHRRRHPYQTAPA